MQAHPSEEHALTADSTHRRIRDDATGRVVGVVPVIQPSTLEERELLVRIDDAREDARKTDQDTFEARRRRARRAWARAPRT